MKFLQILALIFGLVVFADAQKIALTGVVYDLQGAVIVGATVKVTDKKGESFETNSNSDGIYSINLEPGFYNVSFEQGGFKDNVFNNFRVVDSTYGKINQDVVLESGDNHNHEPCGYSGADCINLSPIETQKSKPVNKLPKTQNKSKRKGKKTEPIIIL